MTERPKLTIRKPLSLEKQSQLFHVLKPLHEQTQKAKLQQLHEQRLKEKVAKQKKREEIKTALSWLYEQFPDCFSHQNFKPLKFNIDKDLYPFLKKEGSPSKTKVRDALTYYTNNFDYLKAVINGTHRYDLKGQEVEEIPQEQKDYAQEKLEKSLQRKKAKRL